MEENISYFINAENYEPAEMQPNEFTVIPASNCHAIISDHCYGLPYQDHNYGAVLSPGAAPRAHGGRCGRGNSTSGQQTSVARSAAAAVKQPHPAAGSGNFTSLAGPPSLERNSCSDEDNQEFFSPNLNPAASPVFFPFSNSNNAQSCNAGVNPAFPVIRTSSSFHILKTDSEVEIATTTQALPQYDLFGVNSAKNRQSQNASRLLECPAPKVGVSVLDNVSHSYAAVDRSEASSRGYRPRPQQRRPKAAPSSASAATPVSSAAQITYFSSLPVANPTNYRDFPESHSTAAVVPAPSSDVVSSSIIGSPPSFDGSPGSEPVVGFVPLMPEAFFSGTQNVDSVAGHGKPFLPPKRPGRPRGAKSSGALPRTPKRRRRSNVDAPPFSVSSVEPYAQAEASGDFPVTLAPNTPVPSSNFEASALSNFASPVISAPLTKFNSAATIVQTLREAAALPPPPTIPKKTKRSAPVEESVAADASGSPVDFTEAYKSLYERLFKQLGVRDEDEPVDLDSPVGVSRTREQLSRFVAAAVAGPVSETVAQLVSPAAAPSEPATASSTTNSGISPAPPDQASNTDTDDDGDQSDSSDESVAMPSQQTSSSSASEDDEWAGQQYTTSCLCGMAHNDEFMIQCDRCEVWQHCDCMGLRKKSVPEQYFCHRCQQRDLKFTREQARQLQKRKLRLSAESRRKRSAGRGGSAKRRAEGPRSKTGLAKDKRRKRVEALRNTEIVEEFYANFIKIDRNDYAPDILKALRAASDNVGCGLLEQLPAGAPCLVMYVTKERRGLVANITIPPGQPILEFRGRVCPVSEFAGRDAAGRVLPYVLFYRGLQKADGSSHALDLCVDARFRGTDARFVRRSCQPNTQVKHLIKNGELHLLLVATELIESATEVTIPFDYDYRLCKYEVECACKILGNVDCPVQRSAAQLSARSAINLANSPGVPGDAPPGPPPVGKKKNASALKSKSPKAKSESLTSKALKSKPVGLSSNRGKMTAGPKNKANRSGLKVKLKKRPEKVSSQSPLSSTLRAGVEPNRRRSTSSHVISEMSSIERTGGQRRTISEQSGSEEGFGSAVDRSPPMSREEKKIRQLMEQIERMEQRERRKQEKKFATPKEIFALKKLEPGIIENVQFSSLCTVGNDEHKFEVDRTGVDIANVSGTTEDTLNDTSKSLLPQLAAGADAERNVAKKRWLRQALSDESASKMRFEANSLTEHIPIVPAAFSEAAASATPPLKNPYFSPTLDEFSNKEETSVENEDFESTPVAVEEHCRSQTSTEDLDESRVVVQTIVNDAYVAPESESQLLQNEPIKKKVKMSLDEYKKRKRTSDGPTCAAWQLDSANVDVDPEPQQPSPLSALADAAAGGSKMLASFIPKLKESDIFTKSVRLGSLPDPSSIGKCSATLDDLRRRIYGRSFTSDVLSETSEEAADINLEKPQTKQQSESDLEFSPEQTRHRMSLMDRLKTEFGLDEHV